MRRQDKERETSLEYFKTPYQLTAGIAKWTNQEQLEDKD